MSAEDEILGKRLSSELPWPARWEGIPSVSICCRRGRQVSTIVLLEAFAGLRNFRFDVLLEQTTGGHQAQRKILQSCPSQCPSKEKHQSTFDEVVQSLNPVVFNHPANGALHKF